MNILKQKEIFSNNLVDEIGDKLLLSIYKSRNLIGVDEKLNKIIEEAVESIFPEME